MLKLRFGPFAESNWNVPMNTPGFNNAIRELGIEVVKNGEDVLFQDICYLGPVQQPTIAWMRCDTSRILPEALVFEDDPNLLGFCVPMLAVEPDQSIAIPVHNGGDDFELPTKPVGVITTMLWNRMRQGWTRSIEIPEKRIRASFCGTVHYPQVPFTERHRRNMMDNWPLRGTFAMFNGVRHYFFNEQQQFEFCRHAKVVVSPWGVCEVSVRDYEAVMACCMMVKPTQSEMIINCNPWHEENTVYCKPDFSDLDEAISKAEELYDIDTLRDLANAMLTEGADISRFAEHAAKAIHKCCT